MLSPQGAEIGLKDALWSKMPKFNQNGFKLIAKGTKRSLRRFPSRAVNVMNEFPSIIMNKVPEKARRSEKISYPMALQRTQIELDEVVFAPEDKNYDIDIFKLWKCLQLGGREMCIKISINVKSLPEYLISPVEDSEAHSRKEIEYSPCPDDLIPPGCGG
ncbi:hypothetical protein Tco_0551708 [Tanacetum coccineum]